MKNYEKFDLFCSKQKEKSQSFQAQKFEGNFLILCSYKKMFN